MIDHVPPVALSFGRWTLAFLLIVPLVAFSISRQTLRLVRRNIGLLLLLGLTGITCYHSVVYLGLRSTTAVNAAIITSASPAVIVLLGWMLTREKSSVQQVAGIALSIVGVAIVVTRGDVDSLRAVSFNIGDLVVLASLPMWATYSVLLRRCPPELHGLTLIFLMAGMGLLTTVPALVAEAHVLPSPTPSIETMLALLYLALFPSIGAYICWNAAVGDVGSNIAGFSMNLVPIFATGLAMVFLGEQVRLFHLIGLAITLAGVFLAIGRPTAGPPDSIHRGG